MGKKIPYTEAYIGMVVKDYKDVETDPNFHRKWLHVPGGYKLVETRSTPQWAKEWTPTKDPKGIVTEKDRWHLDPTTKVYIKEEDKLGGEPVGKFGGEMSTILMVGAAIVALWYLLLGGIKKG